MITWPSRSPEYRWGVTSVHFACLIQHCIMDTFQECFLALNEGDPQHMGSVGLTTALWTQSVGMWYLNMDNFYLDILSLQNKEFLNKSHIFYPCLKIYIKVEQTSFYLYYSACNFYIWFFDKNYVFYAVLIFFLTFFQLNEKTKNREEKVCNSGVSFYS